MPEENQIGPVDVVRDSDGWWWHPGIPEFDEDIEACKAWLDGQGLKVVSWLSLLRRNRRQPWRCAGHQAQRVGRA